MIKKIKIKQIPTVCGTDKDGIIASKEWHGQIDAELTNGFLMKIKIRTKNNLNDVVVGINKGLIRVLDDDRKFGLPLDKN